MYIIKFMFMISRVSRLHLKTNHKDLESKSIYIFHSQAWVQVMKFKYQD